MEGPYGEVAALIRREHAERGSPYLVSISGGVAAGKSWTAALLHELLSSSGELRVEVVGSDGFLFPNAVLDRLGLSARKGFPESYNGEALAAFLDEVRAREPAAAAPVYSHLTYDVIGGELHAVGQPDVLIMEGLGLQSVDRFDLSIYVDAADADLEAWFVSRFRELLQAGATDESSFYFRFAALPVDEADQLARAVWSAVNLVNLHEHIIPARSKARIVIEKGADHSVRMLSIRG